MFCTSQEFAEVFPQFILAGIKQRLARQCRERFRLNFVHQFARRPFRWHEVVPPARAHSRRKLQDALRNGVATAKIVEQPAIQLRGPQVALYSVDISAHIQKMSLPFALIAANDLSRVVHQETKHLLFRHAANFDAFCAAAITGKNSTRASLARFSTAGACRRTFRAPPITPVISSLLARGCTRTGNDTVPAAMFSDISGNISSSPSPFILHRSLDLHI